MKNTFKFLMVAFLATSMVFTSCKKKEVEEPKSDNMIGNWVLYEASTKLMMLDIEKLKGFGFEGSIEFKNDTDCAVVFKAIDKNYNVPGTWKRIDDKTIELSMKEAIEIISGTDKTITLTKDNDFYTTDMQINIANLYTGQATAKFKKK